MPLHSLARDFLAQREAMGAKPVHQLSVEAAREQALRIAKAMGAGESVGHVENHVVPGPNGEIPIRIYAPERQRPLPVLTYFHGGGWVTGNLDTADQFCRLIANAAGCLVVSVNYRHAPEHPFPIPAEDAYAATRWVSGHADAFNSDAARLGVGGHSAGGNLAAVVALMARDRGTPPLVHQLLIVPVIDPACGSASYRENAEGYGLTAGSMRWFWGHYLHRQEDANHPYASPLRASNLRGLPPAFVATAEFDPLRDEGETYAARLQADGVPTVHRRYAGMIHGFLGPQATPDIAEALRGALG